MTARSLTVIFVWLALLAGATACSGPASKLAKNITFETDEGSWISLDVAPSGEMLVFDLLGDLYVLPINGGTARPIIRGREFLSQPRFSPDGTTVAFISDRSGEDNLWLANTDGTNIRQISNRGDGEMFSPAWSDDGETVYVSELPGRRSMTSNVAIWAYPINGGEPRALTTPSMGPGSMLVSTFPPGAYGPQPSVKLGKIFFAAAAPRQHGDASGPRANIMTVDLATSDIDAISSQIEPAFRPQLSSDAKWLAYGAVRANTTGLRLRNLQSGAERWLLKDIGFNALESWASRDMLPGYAFTPDNQSLIVAYDGRIQRVDLMERHVTQIPFNVKVEMDVEPRVSINKRINQGPVTARMAKSAVISPDGTQFAFSSFGRLHKVAVADEIPVKLTDESKFGEFHPAWSPDGAWLTFVTWSASDGGAIWKVPVDGTAPAERLTTDSAYYRNPVWSPDGKSIMAVRAPKKLRLENAPGPLAQAEQIIRLASSGGAFQSVAPAAGVTRIHFSKDKQRFYGYSPGFGLNSWNVDGSDRKTLLKVMGLASPASFPAMAADILLSPDGEYALATVASQLYIVDMSAVATENPSVNVFTPGTAYTKITKLGADHFSWADSNVLSWSAGNTLYLKAIDSETIDELDALVTKPRPIPGGIVVLRGAHIITMNGDKVFPDGDIIIHGNRIHDVGESGTLEIPDTATIFDVSGKTIMPGIIDIHAHWSVKRSVLDLQDHNAYANLAYGVTAIRDPQSITDDIFVYADAVDSGEMVGPRIFSTGRGVFFFNNFQSYEEVRAVLERYKKKYRTHLIKSYLPGNRQVRQWVVRACQELGLIVTAEGGADAKMNITFAIDGFSGNEHAVPIVPLQKDIVQLYARTGISYTPTLLVSFGGPFAADHFISKEIGLKDEKLHRFMPSTLIKQRIAASNHVEPEQHIFSLVAKGAKEILDAGGNVGLGGHGEMQGLQVHWEMWALAAGGMTNLDVLRIATIESAKAIGLDQDLGSIENGKLADLVVMDNNPLDNIGHTNSISRVMVNGTLYNANTLAQQWPERKTLQLPWWPDTQQH